MGGVYDLTLRTTYASIGQPWDVEVLVGDGSSYASQGTLNITSTQSPDYQAFYDWTLAGVALSAGPQVIRLKVHDSGGGFNFDYFTLTSKQQASNGTATAIASTGTTRIEAEAFDAGGQGISFYDSSTLNPTGVETSSSTNPNRTWVSSTHAGEWLEFTINVATSGLFNLKFNVAASSNPSTDDLSIWTGDGLNLKNFIGTVDVPNTGGASTYQTLTLSSISLSAGLQVIRLSLPHGGFNFDWIEFEAI